jgi:hypothetical protein
VPKWENGGQIDKFLTFKLNIDIVSNPYQVELFRKQRRAKESEKVKVLSG